MNHFYRHNGKSQIVLQTNDSSLRMARLSKVVPRVDTRRHCSRLMSNHLCSARSRLNAANVFFTPDPRAKEAANVRNMALNLTVKVHPVVLFQIVDAFERRKAESHRVIGTLLGTCEKGVVEVTNCFCVPHKESESQVEADLTYGIDLYDLNHRVNGLENIVGWWATGNEVTTHSSVIHEYYVRECNNPVHITVDTTLTNTTRMAVKAYVCVPLGVPNGKQGSMFTPVKVQVTCYDPEVVGLQLCSKTQLAAHAQLTGGKTVPGIEPMMDLAQIAEASAKLASLLDQVTTYVDDVLNGKQPPDNQVGRALLDMVHSVPKMSPDQFDEMFNSNVKDLLMVVALSQLIKTQLQLNEKLTLLTTL